MPKKDKQRVFSWPGVFISLLIIIFALFLVFVVYSYSDMKRVRQEMYNLNQNVLMLQAKNEQEYNKLDENVDEMKEALVEITVETPLAGAP